MTVDDSRQMSAFLEAPKLPQTAPPSASPIRARGAELFSADFLISVALVGDGLMILLGLLAGFWIRFKSGWITFGVEANYPFELADYFGLICVGLGFLLLAFGYLRLYDTRNLLRGRQVALIIFKASTFWLFAYAGVSLALKFQPPISRIYVLLSYFATVTILLAWRWCFHWLISRESIAAALRQRIIFVGWNQEAKRLAEMVEVDPSHPYHVVGCLPSPLGTFDSQPPKTVPILGEYGDVEKILRQRCADMVVLTDLNPDMTKIIGLSNCCEQEFVQFKVIPSYFQILVSGLQLETISGVPILGVSQLPLDNLANRFCKRTVDILGATVGLILSAPLMAGLSALIYLESPGPIFYRQIRTGRNGTNFKIIKLRSMRVDAEVAGGARWAERDDPRRLRIGAFMREWNLDEIPQFWNVLKGEMSLVGPRPERPELIAGFKHQIPHYNARHASKPGMTGWAQVNGLRGDTDLTERVRYDLFYLENWSLWLDLQIIIQTFFRRENAY